MKIKEITDYIERAAPLELALSWDNVGLMLGSLEGETESVVFALDFTSEVLSACIETGAKLVITHHPFIFSPIKNISEDTPLGKLATEAIRNGITVCSYHTNLDFAEGGINDTLIEMLDIVDFKKDESGEHSYGELFGEITFEEFLEFVKFTLSAPAARAVIPRGKSAQDRVKTIAVSCGAFDGEYDWIKNVGADVLVTGELKHHNAAELKERGVFAISAGHFETEEPGLERLAECVTTEFKIKTKIITECNPFTDI